MKGRTRMLPVAYGLQDLPEDGFIYPCPDCIHWTVQIHDAAAGTGEGPTIWEWHEASCDAVAGFDAGQGE